jgi:hypothetical protein
MWTRKNAKIKADSGFESRDDLLSQTRTIEYTYPGDDSARTHEQS